MYQCTTIPVGERKSYSGTTKAGSEPRPISEMTEATTELRITIAVELGREEEESAAEEGHNTDSTAKKHPPTAALKPIISQTNFHLTWQFYISYLSIRKLTIAHKNLSSYCFKLYTIQVS